MSRPIGISRKYDYEKVYEEMLEFYDQHGYPASIRDITSLCGISSTSTVNHIIDDLERQGKVKRIRGIGRGIVPIRLSA